MRTSRLVFFLLLFCNALVPATVLLAADNQANVFIYHRFGESRYPSTNISVDLFAQQLEILQAGGYHVMKLGTIVELIRHRRALPDKAVAITVDDAYESFYRQAMPLLEKFGYPVTLFVNTDSVGSHGYLDWEQLRILAAAGVEIGNHSASHLFMLDRRNNEDSSAWLERVAADLQKAQKALLDHLGVEAQLFAYPYGEFEPRLQQLVEDLGFQGAAAQQSGVVSPASDLYALPRFPMGGAFAQLSGFREKLTMRALPLKVVEPESPVVGGENPPELVVDVDLSDLRSAELRCFVPGQSSPQLIADPDKPGRFIIKADQQLRSRRSKYTLTAPGKNGGWYWFSQPWFQPGVAEGY